MPGRNKPCGKKGRGLDLRPACHRNAAAQQPSTVQAGSREKGSEEAKLYQIQRTGVPDSGLCTSDTRVPHLSTGHRIVHTGPDTKLLHLSTGHI